MQANYPDKLSSVHWDTLNVEYPVRQFLPVGRSSETIARSCREQPEIIRDIRQPIYEELEYNRDYNVNKELTRSQSAIDHGYKESERFRFNKHTPLGQNEYVYPPCRKLSERPPAITAHQTTEMSSYKSPAVACALITDKDQYKHPASLPSVSPDVPSHQKELEPLDTTHEGFEKYLDPYLTTNRLHHRPYTENEWTKKSNSKDILTYYTYADIPWVRKQQPKNDEWRLPLSRPKSMYDKAKFKEDLRELRTHNRLCWVPGTFRTESRDNYVDQTSRPKPQIHNYEEEVRTFYQRATAQLTTNIFQEDISTHDRYKTENLVVGSKKPLCAVIDQYVHKNKRLTKR